MSAPDLPEHLEKAGSKLLAALDSAGLGAQGVAWMFDHTLGDWRFVVATSLVESMGRSKVYKLLLDVMENLDVPKDLTVEDIHLVTTEGPFFMTVGSAMRVEGGGLIRVKNCTINGAKFDAVIYRWSARPPTPPEMKQVEKQFKRRVKELSR